MTRPTLCIDIDGVIATGTVKDVYSKGAGWAYEKCTLIKGALEAIKELSRKYDIVLYTSRWVSDERKTSIWLKEQGIEPYIKRLNIGSKPSAVAYIDDKAYHFSNWEQTLKDFDNPEHLTLTPQKEGE